MKNTIINEVAQLAGTDCNAKVEAIQAAGGRVVFTVVGNMTYCTVTINGATRTATSICDPADEFDGNVGRAIALYRALSVQAPAAYTKDAHVYIEKAEDIDGACVGCPHITFCYGSATPESEDPTVRRNRIVAVAKHDYETRVKEIVDNGGSVRAQRVEGNVYVAVSRSGHTLTGVSQCSPRDVFNLELGLAIALYRALEFPVPTDYVTCGVRKEKPVDLAQFVNPIYDGRCTDCGKDAGECMHTADCADESVMDIINEFEGDTVAIAIALDELRKAVNALKC